MSYIDKVRIGTDEYDLHDVGAVRADAAQVLTDAQGYQARANIAAEKTPDGSIAAHLATLNYVYNEANGRQVIVYGNRITLTRKSSTGSTNHARSIIGAAYSSAVDTQTINTQANRANIFRAMYTAGAYVALKRMPLFTDATHNTRYMVRSSQWVNDISGSQRAAIMFGTYNPDTDTVVECGSSDIWSVNVDGTDVYFHPLFREFQLTDAFVEAVNANQNIMAMLCIRSGGGVDNELEIVWDIVPRRAVDPVTTVSEATAAITAAMGQRYVCSTPVTELTFIPPVSGICSVRFKAASGCVLSFGSGVTVALPAWFDKNNLVTGTTYEITFCDRYGVVTTWT